MYPLVGFHFKVEVALPDVAPENSEVRFQEVVGIKKDLGVEEFQEGGENRFTHKLPNPARYPNLVLKRGVVKSSKLIQWCFDAIDHFEFKPVDLKVTLLNEEHSPSITWDFVRAYPLKWSVSDLKAQDNSILIETLEIAYQYYRKGDV